MPTFKEMQQVYANIGTVGQQIKQQSDDAMEATWDNDIQSKVCYIYDYYHDDEPTLNKNIHHTHKTTKTRIDAKFIIKSYSSLDKDQVEYYLQFKPSQKTRFEPTDELYYFETDYRNVYMQDFPIGLYCDIPDDQGIYNRWIICSKEIGNQFIKYNILPCDYWFHFIVKKNGKRYKRKIWGVTRTQSSYNSGLWTDYYSTSTESQFKAIVPLNPITEDIYYITEDNINQRIIISAPVKNPNVYKISKVETVPFVGLKRLTFAQDKWNPFTDGFDEEDFAKGDRYAMYADLFTSTVSPDTPKHDEIICNTIHCDLSCNANKIKVGGSYKLITASFFDDNDTDITSNYIPYLSLQSWSCLLRENELSDPNNDIDITNSDLITWLEQSDQNKIKIKFSNNKEYLTKILVIKCSITVGGRNIVGEVHLQVSSVL